MALHYRVVPIDTSIWFPQGVRGGAFAIYFDGEFIWVTNPNGQNGNLGPYQSSIVKIRASDQAYIGADGLPTDLTGATYPVGTGNGWITTGISGDGTYIWTINNQVHQVTKHNRSDGVQVAAYALGANVYPRGYSFEFDGTYFWTCVSAGSNNLMRVRASDGALTFFTTALTPLALVYDSVNTCIWTYSEIAWNNAHGYICKIGLDGSLLAQYDLGSTTINTGHPGITTDGEYVWFVLGGFGELGIAKLRCSDGAFINTDGTVGTLTSATFDVVNRTTFPSPAYAGLRRVSDPLNSQELLWVASYTQVSAMQVLPGGINGLVTNYTASAGGASDGYNLFCLAYDGVNAWATNYDGSYVSWVDPYNAELLASDATLVLPDVLGSEIFAQTATFPPPKPPPSTRYDLNIYGLSLDTVTGVQFIPYGPQFELRQTVVIEQINNEFNQAGTLPFIIPYDQGEGVSTRFDVYGQNFDFVYGMQFVPYGPISGDPSPTPTGPAEPPIPLAEGGYYYNDPFQIGIYSWDMLNYLSNGTFQRDTWYKLLLHCNEQQAQVDPTLSPTGPPVPAIPLVPPDFALVTPQHIGIPYTIQQWLLTNGILYYETWYKFYLTYDCGFIPPIVPEARAIHPNQGWNWDPAYVVAPNIIYSQVIDEFNGTLSGWVTPTYGAASATQSNIGITLAAGPAIGSIASLNSLVMYPQGDWTIDFNITRPASSDTPPSLFTYLAVEYRLPGDGYGVTVSREYSPDIGHAYTASITSADAPVGGFVPTNAWRGSLRIIRYKSSITLLAKDADQTRWQTVAYTRTAPMGGDGYIAISTTNNDVAQIASTLVERYTLNPGVMFGTEPAVYTEIGNSNINLLVQPQLIDTTRFVTIATYTPTTILKETLKGFEYVRPNQFSLGGQPAGDWWIYRAVPTQPDIEQANVQQDTGTRLLSLVLSPMSGQYQPSQAVQYRAVARFNDGSRQDVTAQCEWTTTDLDGIITQSGLMHYGSTPGTFTITATYRGLSQTAIGRTSRNARFAGLVTLS